MFMLSSGLCDLLLVAIWTVLLVWACVTDCSLFLESSEVNEVLKYVLICFGVYVSVCIPVELSSTGSIIIIY